MTNLDQMSENVKERDRKLDRELLEAPEICIWMAIHGGLLFITDLWGEYCQRKITRKEFIKRANVSLLELAKMADTVHRFNVVMPSHLDRSQHRGKKLEDALIQPDFSSPFWRWYNWWSDYIGKLSETDCHYLYHV